MYYPVLWYTMHHGVSWKCTESSGSSTLVLLLNPYKLSTSNFFLIVCCILACVFLRYYIFVNSLLKRFFWTPINETDNITDSRNVEITLSVLCGSVYTSVINKYARMDDCYEFGVKFENPNGSVQSIIKPLL